MTVEHDTATGRLRCDDDALAALVAGTAADRPASVQEDPRALAALDAVGGALVHGRLVVSGDRGVRDHRFWIAPGAAAFLLALDGPDDGATRGDLIGVAPDRVPGHLARLVHLGPRQAPPGREPRTVLDVGLIEDLAHPSDLRRGSALRLLDAQRAWRIDVRGSSTGGTEERSMTVLDGAGPATAGLWSVDVGALRLDPTTATALWHTLVQVLD